jgi:hypothetical protein
LWHAAEMKILKRNTKFICLPITFSDHLSVFSSKRHNQCKRHLKHAPYMHFTQPYKLPDLQDILFTSTRRNQCRCKIYE